MHVKIDKNMTRQNRTVLHMKKMAKQRQNYACSGKYEHDKTK